MATIFQYTLVSLLLHSCTGFSVNPKSGISSLSSVPTKLAAATALPLELSPAVSEEEEPKVGVLLLNLGGPETGDDVEGVFQSNAIQKKSSTAVAHKSFLTKSRPVPCCAIS